MKRVLSILSCVALLAVGASAFAQPADLPADARYDQPVTFATGSAGEELRAMLIALARTVGLTPVVDDVDPTRTIVYDIGEAKPFRQVWTLVLTLNDLDYELLDNDIVVIGSPASLARLRSSPAEAAVATSPTPAASDLEQRFYRVSNDPEQLATLLGRVVPGIQIDALPGTQALVVSGTPSEHERVAAALAQFDVPPEEIPVAQRIYILSHANADSLADVLSRTSLVVQETNPDTGVVTNSPPEFTVVAESRNNALIVTGTLAAHARLADLIAELDRPQPQVNIQVRIQEITRTNALDLGIDWTVGFGNMSANILSGGLGFIFDTTQVISSLNVLAVLDTLETQGLSRRVDDTNITVVNNGMGSIQAGGKIFITLPGASENIEREIDYGVQVQVTPRITADGRITLEIETSVDDVLSTTSDPNFLELSTRNLNTTVTVEEGQTLLLGGLLHNSLSVSQNRIPILGSIPIIGSLFSRTETSEDNTDLLVIVTAMILD